MNLLRQGSVFGESPYYLAKENRAHAPRLRELLTALDDGARAIDVKGLRQFFERRPDGIRTCFQGAQRLPAGCDLYETNGQLTLQTKKRSAPDGPLLPLLEERLAALLARHRNFAVALSGGLDSALVLALVQRLAGSRSVPILTLATELPGYCELEETLETARALNAGPVDVISVRAEQMVIALPDAIAACETPLYNLHPVTKLLLARAAAQRGFEAIITGDGADQVFAGSDARNYLPIVGALVRSTGVAFLSPFFDEEIAAWAAQHGIDDQKGVLRTAASAVLPPEIAWKKKQPRIAPDFFLENYRDPQFEACLAPKLGLHPPASGPGPAQTLWATSALLIRQLGGTI